jgi:ribonuclease P protein subunit POP4
LNKLWNGYISEILSPKGPTTASDGPTFLRADYHGAYIIIEDCRCESRLGLQGICLKETKKTFEIVTTENRLLKIPKENTLFRIRATIREDEDIEWRLWGDQVLVRSGERASKKFSGRTIRGRALLEL